MVSAPGCDESSQVVILFAYWYTVVTVPCIKDRFYLPMWHRSCLMEWGLSVMGFSDGMSAEGLKVHCAVRFATLLGTDDHLVAPCDKLTKRDWFYDS